MNYPTLLRSTSAGVIAAVIMSVTAVPANAASDLKTIESEIEALKQEVKSASEWKNPRTLIHMAGYADVGFSSAEGPAGSFNAGSFSPIFHYQFSDLVMLESELEFEAEENGSTKVAMEYLTIDLFLNDNAILVAGKFLSPLGQFRQNFHPSWVNKLPSAPAGFGHDQAAPNADVGVQLRGGTRLGGMRANYAIFAANGPAIELNGAGTAFEKIETPGLGADGDGGKVYGGRLGLFFPDSKLDVGLSLAAGKIAVWDSSVSPITYESTRDYGVLGVDFTYRPGNFDFRGEYIQQSVAALAASAVPSSAVWSAYYLQGAYRMLPSKWEAVLRYGRYSSPDADANLTQTAVGVNYIFASNVIGKIAYELNNNPDPTGAAASNRALVQLAYGF